MVLAANITEEIDIPEDVNVTIGDNVIIKGPQGEVSRKFTYPNISMKKRR